MTKPLNIVPFSVLRQLNTPPCEFSDKQATYIASDDPIQSWYFRDSNILYVLRIYIHRMAMFSWYWDTDHQRWESASIKIEYDRKVIGDIFPNQVMEALL